MLKQPLWRLQRTIVVIIVTSIYYDNGNLKKQQIQTAQTRDEKINRISTAYTCIYHVLFCRIPLQMFSVRTCTNMFFTSAQLSLVYFISLICHFYLSFYHSMWNALAVVVVYLSFPCFNVFSFFQIYLFHTNIPISCKSMHLLANLFLSNSNLSFFFSNSNLSHQNPMNCKRSLERSGWDSE